MTTRVFGAVRGAGPQVREVTPSKPILDGPLGSTILIGMFRGGPSQEVVPLDGFDHYRRVFGGPTQSSEAPLAAEDFYKLAAGAGKLYVVAVDDGGSVKARQVLWSRDVNLTVSEVNVDTLPSQTFAVNANSGNRRGGRRNRHSGDVTLSGAITGTGVIDLGFTTGPNGSALVKDAWKGATLRFANDDASWVGTVTTNTAAGIFTVSGDFSAAVIAGTDGRYTLEVDNVHELSTRTEALAVMIKDSGLASDQFNVEAYRDGGFVVAFEDVELDTLGGSHWVDVINDDENQWEFTAADTFTGDVTQALSRPANYAEIPAPGGVSADGNTVTLQTARWTWTDTSGNGGDPYLDTVNDFAPPSEPIPLKITLTFTAATAFTVAAESLETGEPIEGLPAGATGTLYVSQNKWMPAFTVTAGGTAAASTDIVTIYYRPLPANLERLGGLFYPAAAPSEGDTRKAYKIRSNTSESVTFEPGTDVSSEVTAPGAPTQTGTIAGTYDMSSGVLTFIFTLAGRAAVTLTSTLSGAAETATALAADLNAKELADVSAVAADKRVLFTASADDKIVCTSLQDFGPGVALVIGAGGLNAKLGFTDTASSSGATPTIARLEFLQQLEGGVDGFASIADADYIQALGYSTSAPLGELLEANTGLLKLAVPGVTAVAVQAAAMLWAYNTNGFFYAEIPTSESSESAAMQWHEDNLAVGEAAGQNYHRAFYPSHGKRANPYGRGLYTAPMVGAILGVDAREASAAKGFHLAPAGTRYRIDAIFVDLPTGKSTLNNEALNAYGLTEIRRRGSAIFVWGDRVPGDKIRPFLHKRLTMSHIGRILLTNTTDLVFMPISRRSLFTVRRLVRGLFSPWFLAGWFDDSDGQSLEDQVTIKADDTNNPLTSRQAGDVNIAVSFEVVNTGERVIFSLGPKGVSESA